MNYAEPLIHNFMEEEMKKRLNLNCLLLFVILFIPSISVAYKGIEQGSEPGEIYISSRWYATFQCGYYGLYYSTNNGEDIELKYYTPNPFAPDSINLSHPYLISDMTPGVLYCRTSEPDLWISNNYGENWEFVEIPGTSGRYTSGCTPGEIYKNCTDYQGTLYRSIDYGENFEVVNDSAKYIMEVGVQEGELYGIDGSYIEGFKIHYSNDYGETFTQQCILDSIIPVVANPYPTLSRGTEQGELYLESIRKHNFLKFQIVMDKKTRIVGLSSKKFRSFNENSPTKNIIESSSQLGTRSDFSTYGYYLE